CTRGLGAGKSFLGVTVAARGETAPTFVADLQGAPNPGGNRVQPAAFFAADVLNTNNGNTGIINFGVPVPGPIVGAGLPGLVAACGALLALARRRRKLVA